MPVSSDSERLNLYGLDRDALGEIVSERGAPTFHGGQIYRWIHGRRRYEPEDWTDLPIALRRDLARTTRVEPGAIARRTEARDGTIKYEIALADGGSVEAVYMMQAGRVTVCISSQVGCALACDFCLTGKMGLVRHLSAGEIAGQAALIQEDRQLADTAFNVVFMGMGEPLHNYERVMAAVRLLTDPEGFGLSRRRITVSTVGLAPAIERLADESIRPRLAVSLNATTDAARTRLMPINRKYPLRRLLDSCHVFLRKTGDSLSFEYVLLEAVNDSDRDAERLAAILRKTRAKLNLIPFNPVPGHLDYRPPTKRRVLEIRDRLLERGFAVSVRWSRGAEARAACGQLALLPE